MLHVYTVENARIPEKDTLAQLNTHKKTAPRRKAGRHMGYAQMTVYYSAGMKSGSSPVETTYPEI